MDEWLLRHKVLVAKTPWFLLFLMRTFTYIVHCFQVKRNQQPCVGDGSLYILIKRIGAWLVSVIEARGIAARATLGSRYTASGTGHTNWFLSNGLERETLLRNIRTLRVGAEQKAMVVSLQNWLDHHVAVRHCCNQLFGTPNLGINPSADFRFTFVPTGNRSAVVLESLEFKDHSVGAIEGLERGRLGMVPNAQALSFTRVAGLAAPADISAVSFVTDDGRYLCLGPTATISGTCAAQYADAPGAGDALLSDGMSDKGACTWTLLPVPPAAQTRLARIAVDTLAPTKALSKDLFGIFFEEINFAGEGGLYAELIRNRDFEALGRGNLGEVRYAAGNKGGGQRSKSSSTTFVEPAANFSDFRPWTGAGGARLSLENTSAPFRTNP